MIGRAEVASDHSIWNHLVPHQAPHPHCSNASEAIGRSCSLLRKKVPFHSSVKHCHQAKFAWNFWLGVGGPG